jgi:hypothetical protein
VITGRGLHSAGGQPRIKPAVERFLGNSGYEFTALQAGCFRVTLK